MKIHQKAELYDQLVKDYETLINEMLLYHQSVEEIKNSKFDTIQDYPVVVGKYAGSNFGLLIKIKKAEGTLNWYKRQK